MRRITALLIMALVAVTMCACSGGGEEENPYAEYIGLVREMPEFHSVDLEGNEVDNSVFEQADITVINVWGTFCPPCIGELPDLAEWNNELPENVQIIGIVADVPSTDAKEFETAKKLVAENGITYTNIVAGDQFNEEVLSKLVGVPTTFFVGPDGKCIAPDIPGANVKAYRKTVSDLL